MAEILLMTPAHKTPVEKLIVAAPSDFALRRFSRPRQSYWNKGRFLPVPLGGEDAKEMTPIQHETTPWLQNDLAVACSPKGLDTLSIPDALAPDFGAVVVYIDACFPRPCALV